MRAMLVDRTNPQYLGGQFSYLALRSLEYGALSRLFKAGKTSNLTSLTLSAIEQVPTGTIMHSFLQSDGTRNCIRYYRKDVGSLILATPRADLLSKMLEEYPRASMVGIDPSQVAVGRALKFGQDKRITILKEGGESISLRK